MLLLVVLRYLLNRSLIDALLFFDYSFFFRYKDYRGDLETT